MTGAEARELMAPYADSIREVVDRAPEIPDDALELLRATGLGRYLKPTRDVKAAS